MIRMSTRGAGRAAVAAAIDRLSEKGNLLDAELHGSEVRYGGAMPSGHRTRVLKSIIDRYIADGDAKWVVREHRAVMVTAGPPGAGKSRVTQGFEGYRTIDADDVKDLLIGQALADGDYEAQLAQVLPDGHPLVPREMSMLFHVEAWRVIDQVRAIAIARGENVIVQGTLAHRPYADELLEELLRADYLDLEVIAVDISAVTAHRQAMNRWWSGRQDAISGGDPWGGRYVNVHRLASTFWAEDGESLCSRNARRMERAASEAGMSTRLRVVSRNTGVGSERRRHSLGTD